MKIGLIDVDGHNYPNLALMKISAFHKNQGDIVDWWNGFEQYDRVYMSKVFDNTYSPDMPEPYNTRELIKGGTGYGLDNTLPEAIEHMYPDYSLYPQYTDDTAYGFLTRGCPRGCSFCIVADKEGRRSVKVADLNEFWRGQKNIVLMDPNILAYHGHMELLKQLEESGSYVDFNQGLDCRLLTEENIAIINRIKIKDIHFAWDEVKTPAQVSSVIMGLQRYRKNAKRKPHGAWATVYVLVNHGTTERQDLMRIKMLEAMEYTPYVMVFDKPNAPQRCKDLQRWCNSIKIRKKCPDFNDYKRGGI